MEDLRKLASEIFPFILLGLTGGLARLMIDSQNKKINPQKFLSAMFVAGFVAAMTGFILETLPLHSGFKFFLAGNSGFAAGTLVEVYEDKVIKYLKRMVK